MPETIDRHKTALIFAGSRGIGAAIGKRLGKAGFRGALTYVSRSDRAREVIDAIDADGGATLAIELE
jgi:3-oxoacyl-[acyl-carrier protein] reductase